VTDRERLAAVSFIVAPDTTLAGALDSFLLDCEAGSKSPNTVGNYRKQLGRFVAWLGKRGITTLDAVTANELRGYLAELQRRGLRDTTRHTSGSILRRWCTWLEAEGLVRSPMRNVTVPRAKLHILPAFTAQDVKALLAACTCARDRLIILCLLDTGCRAAEFVALNVADVDLDSGRVMVWAGKGGKDRVTAIGDRSRRMLAAYLELEYPNASGGEPLWISHPRARCNIGDGRLTDNWLRQLLERIGNRAGVKHCYPHRFRRTCALMMHRSGARVTEIAQLMGHSDLATLKRYLDFQGQDAADAHREHGPVDRLGLV
jgi:integrase/recombinase XerD